MDADNYTFWFIGNGSTDTLAHKKSCDIEMTCCQAAIAFVILQRIKMVIVVLFLDF